jgi:hypothetical protein
MNADTIIRIDKLKEETEQKISGDRLKLDTIIKEIEKKLTSLSALIKNNEEINVDLNKKIENCNLVIQKNFTKNNSDASELKKNIEMNHKDVLAKLDDTNKMVDKN